LESLRQHAQAVRFGSIEQYYSRRDVQSVVVCSGGGGIPVGIHGRRASRVVLRVRPFCGFEFLQEDGYGFAISRRDLAQDIGNRKEQLSTDPIPPRLVRQGLQNSTHCGRRRWAEFAQLTDCGHTPPRISRRLDEQAQAVSFGSDLVQRGGRGQGLASVGRVENALERRESVLRRVPNISQGPDNTKARRRISKRPDQRRHGSARVAAKAFQRLRSKNPVKPIRAPEGLNQKRNSLGTSLTHGAEQIHCQSVSRMFRRGEPRSQPRHQDLRRGANGPQQLACVVPAGLLSGNPGQDSSERQRDF